MGLVFQTEGKPRQGATQQADEYRGVRFVGETASHMGRCAKEAVKAGISWKGSASQALDT